MRVVVGVGEISTQAPPLLLCVDLCQVATWTHWPPFSLYEDFRQVRGVGVMEPHGEGSHGAPTGQNPPNSGELRAERKQVKASARTFRAGPDWFFESRTGTVPWDAARLVAISTQTPPFSLYDDLNQRGDSVLT